FQKDYQPGGAEVKPQVVSRLRAFIYGEPTPRRGRARGRAPIYGIDGGEGRLVVSVTPPEIDRWIDEYPTASKVTKIHVAGLLSVFWHTLRRLYGLSSIPIGKGVTKPRGDLVALARKRSPTAIKDVDELKTFLNCFIDPEKPNDIEGLYW